MISGKRIVKLLISKPTRPLLCLDKRYYLLNGQFSYFQLKMTFDWHRVIYWWLPRVISFHSYLSILDLKYLNPLPEKNKNSLVQKFSLVLLLKVWTVKIMRRDIEPATSKYYVRSPRLTLSSLKIKKRWSVTNAFQ